MEKKEQEQLQLEEDEQDIVIGLEEAANVLGITAGRVDQLIHEGKLKAYDIGVGKQRGRWAFRREDLEAVLGLEQTARGHRKHRGSINEKYVFPLEAARLLGVDYAEVMYQVERRELQAPFVVKRNDRTVVAILSSSVQELMEKRRLVITHDPLQYPLLDLWQVAEMLNVEVKAVRDLVKEDQLLMLNITPKGPYQIWRIVTSSLKQYHMPTTLLPHLDEEQRLLCIQQVLADAAYCCTVLCLAYQLDLTTLPVRAKWPHDAIATQREERLQQLLGQVLLQCWSHSRAFTPENLQKDRDLRKHEAGIQIGCTWYVLLELAKWCDADLVALLSNYRRKEEQESE